MNKKVQRARKPHVNSGVSCKGKMDGYLDRSGKAMLAVMLTYDHARAAEKMADFNCIGDNNAAWEKGPYLSSGANQKQIDRTHPYCFRTSDEFSIVSKMVLGPNPKKHKNGGVRIPLPPKDEHNSRVEPVISKLAIIEQFELFKDFLMTFDGPFNKKRCKEWEGKIEHSLLDLVGELTDRRNELTHDSDHPLPSIQEAVAYFYHLRKLAKKLFHASQLAV